MRTVPKSEILNAIRQENPWWSNDGRSGRFSHLKERPYIELFFPLLKERVANRAIVLMGPRRVGKTVLLHHSVDRLLDEGIGKNQLGMVSIDNPVYNELRLEQVFKLVSEASENSESGLRYVFFDEIQYLRDWEVHLKVLVDQHPEIQFVVSGSAAAALRLKSIESGAGRLTDFLLPPLTFHEYLTLLQSNLELARKDEDRIFTCDDLQGLNKSFIDYINFGGYPEIALNKAIQGNMGRFLKSDIIDKVLLRDLPSLYGIANIQELNSLFTTLAYNTADEVSLEKLSTGAGVSKNTLRKYIEYLEAAFLIKSIKRIDEGGRRFRRTNHFKVYLTNPSIYSALFSSKGAEDDAMGQLAETAVFSQWFHSNTNLNYARWKEGEIDIVNAADFTPEWAVEVKWSDHYVDKLPKLRHLATFCNKNALDEIAITTRSIRTTKQVGDVTYRFYPTAEYCFTVGFNLLRQKRDNR